MLLFNNIKKYLLYSREFRLYFSLFMGMLMIFKTQMQICIAIEILFFMRFMECFCLFYLIYRSIFWWGAGAQSRPIVEKGKLVTEIKRRAVTTRLGGLVLRYQASELCGFRELPVSQQYIPEMQSAWIVPILSCSENER